MAGLITTTSGSQIPCDEVEGHVSLQELYDNVQNTNYTSGYRADMIKACGKVGRGAFGILMYLHDLVNQTTKIEKDKELVDVAKEAIRKIDPGMPDFGSPATTPESKSQVKATISSPKKSVAGKLTFPIVNGNGVTVYKELEKMKVKVTMSETDDLAEGTRVYGTCNFCEKTSVFSNNIQEFNRNIVGKDRMFCSVCLRNSMYRPRISKNTLMLTYRGIIGYYYHCFHVAGKNPTMWLSDIQGYIELHQRFGYNNPLFRYDPETYIWFVDFSRVGTGKRKVPVEHILETVVQQIAAFNLYDVIKDSTPVKLYDKYKQAILEFQHHRRRPPESRILSPTLYGCGIPHDNNLGKAIANESLKRFLPSQMVDNFKDKKKNNHSCY